MTPHQLHTLDVICDGANPHALGPTARAAVVAMRDERDELLAACEAIKHWIEEDTLVDLDELSDDAKEILETVRAAIAAAKDGS